MGHTTRDELQRIAEETFGWAKLHPEQLEAMEQVMAGHDVLAVLPTGAGKSAVYRCRPWTSRGRPWSCRR
jgi:ATP-dependent DNA helicase RecQ